MRPAKKLTPKVDKWKEKAKERTKIIARQNRKLKRLGVRLDKAKKEKEVIKRENADLKRRLEQPGRMSRTPVKHHSFDAELIQLCLRLRSASGCSYRGCVNILKVLIVCMGLNIKVPSMWSIRNWEIKYGLHNLTRRSTNDDGWALIIDESVSIGSEKLLLLLGVNLKTYTFESPLSHGDIRVLDIRLSKSWPAESVHEVIEDVKKRRYNLVYACSDSGNNLCKALKISNLRRVSDCGHKFGNWLKTNYQKDEDFIDFRKESNDMKKRLILSKHAELVPPKQRAKGRYLNISAISKWAAKLLFLCKKYKRRKRPPEAFEKISWLLDYRELISNLNKEQCLINEVNKILKTKGLSRESAEECCTLITGKKVCKSLKDYIQDYLVEQLNLMDGEEKVVCSSDVIESMFGLFKYRNSKNPGSSITESCLAIASYGEKAEVEELKKAMEAVSIVDLKRWRKNNLAKSVAQKRLELFKKAG